MLKVSRYFLIVLIVCSAVCSNVYAMSAEDFLYTHEWRIQDMCEAQQINADSPFRGFLQFPGRFECGLTQFHALHKVIDLLLTIDRSSEDWKVFTKIMDENIIDDYETFDFMNIHLEYLAYLEAKSG